MYIIYTKKIKYKYPHDFGGYVKQQYMPDNLKDKIYYVWHLFTNYQPCKEAGEYDPGWREKWLNQKRPRTGTGVGFIKEGHWNSSDDILYVQTVN